MDKAAQQEIHLPIICQSQKVEGSPYDFSFSGLKTAVINAIHNANQKGNHPKNDMAAAFQQTVCDILADKTMKAANKEFGYTDIVIAGAYPQIPVSGRDLNRSAGRGAIGCLSHHCPYVGTMLPW